MQFSVISLHSAPPNITFHIICSPNGKQKRISTEIFMTEIQTLCAVCDVKTRRDRALGTQTQTQTRTHGRPEKKRGKKRKTLRGTELK